MRRSFRITLLLTAAVAASAAAQSAPTFVNPPSLATPRGYSQAAVVPAGSRIVYLSGQVAQDRDGKVVGAGDFRAQAEQVFANIGTALADLGATYKDVVKLNLYVLDVANLPVLREVRDRHVNTAAPPASTLVEVKRLFRDEFLLEVEAVVVVPAKAP